MNLYAYVGNNPLSFTDPFGLCIDDDETCKDLVKQLRAQKGSEFQQAADRFEALKDKRVQWVSGDDSRLNRDGVNRDGDAETWRGGLVTNGEVLLNAEFSAGDRLISAVHESLHLAGVQTDRGSDLTTLAHGERRAYRQLTPILRATAVRHSDRFFHWWGPRFGSHPVPLKEPGR